MVSTTNRMISTTTSIATSMVPGNTIAFQRLVNIIYIDYDRNVTCNPNCLNGGTCVAMNTCQCVTNVWIGPYCQTPMRILWAFDNNLNDLYNKFQGVGSNRPTYRSPGITGYGTCLYLNATSSQSVTIFTPPFINMALTSFSLFAWVKATSFHNTAIGSYSDNAIFGQCQQTVQDECLHLIVRNQYIYFGFFADDISSVTLLSTNTWYHIGYVYDYSARTQYIYVNGVLDVSGSPKGPYQGSMGNLTIGTNVLNFPNNYWDGCIDQVSYAALAKNATEVLYEATLTFSYSFENNLIDSGTLGINGTGITIGYSTSGRVNNCLSLLSNLSYVQATNLVLLGTVGQPYSFSIWIKPNTVAGGTIFHVSSGTAGLGGWCIPMLGFTSSGKVGVQSLGSSSVSITGPVTTTNVWTHLAVTYGPSGGLRLYVNGAQYGSASGNYTYQAAGTPVSLLLGSSLSGLGSCASSVITMGQYNGYIDEFELYSRELSSANVYSLANP
ncbi:unnamed protein product [Rotaria socialis]|uniref:EGF-like domain-containing protein n=2 Tax=Rotaria socialis TaxID=392032 RepID=A0A818QS17_9BILA|nr:unnamed protein product [Rotaria socialis]